MKTILVTGIGGPTPRSIAKYLRDTYNDVRLIGIDANPKAIGFFMDGLVDAHELVPRVSSDNYWTCIYEIIAKYNVDMAIVQPEQEVIAWGEYYISHGEYPCPVFLPNPTLAKSLVDKSIMSELLSGTEFIPKTIKVTQSKPRYEEVEKVIGFPCWIRATKGSGGLGSLKLKDLSSYKSWLFINSDIEEFTVSEFLTGRHLANQMLYYNNKLYKAASLHCAEYVMANVAPSRVTGNTSYGIFINDDKLTDFCDRCVRYLCDKLGVDAHGVLSFDLKEDKDGNLKVTEINVRHMAYTGIMSRVGFDLISDCVDITLHGDAHHVVENPYWHYDKEYVFLRDVDIEPIILDSKF